MSHISNLSNYEQLKANIMESFNKIIKENEELKNENEELKNKNIILKNELKEKIDPLPQKVIKSVKIKDMPSHIEAFEKATKFAEEEQAPLSDVIERAEKEKKALKEALLKAKAEADAILKEVIVKEVKYVKAINLSNKKIEAFENYDLLIEEEDSSLSEVIERGEKEKKALKEALLKAKQEYTFLKEEKYKNEIDKTHVQIHSIINQNCCANPRKVVSNDGNKHQKCMNCGWEVYL
jgi:phage gp36-like protein